MQGLHVLWFFGSRDAPGPSCSRNGNPASVDQCFEAPGFRRSRVSRFPDFWVPECPDFGMSRCPESAFSGGGGLRLSGFLGRWRGNAGATLVEACAGWRELLPVPIMRANRSETPTSGRSINCPARHVYHMPQGNCSHLRRRPSVLTRLYEGLRGTSVTAPNGNRAYLLKRPCPLAPTIRGPARDVNGGDPGISRVAVRATTRWGSNCTTAGSERQKHRPSRNCAYSLKWPCISPHAERVE